MCKPVQGFAADALGMLLAHSWPGNVRELENVVERAVALETADQIQAATLGDHLGDGRSVASAATTRTAEAVPGAGFSLEQHLQEIERAHVERALKQTGGVQVRAAELLGLSFRQFRYLMKKYSVRA
jgi:two-component system response regulator PilR (NtrC family)